MRALLEALILASVFVWSAIEPHDRFTWWLEVIPAIVGFPVVLYLHRNYRFSNVSRSLLCLWAVILLVGGHYTYAEVPLFNWIRDHFHLLRNHYDRVGHFVQGVVPAMLAREYLLRTTAVQGKRGLLFFLASCVALAISASYELIEWWVSLLTGEGGTAFLGTQGDVWDTQWDMAMALLGSVTSQLLLGRWLDRNLESADS